MIVGSVCAFRCFRGVAVLTFLGMSRQLPVTTALHLASGKTLNFCQSPLSFCAQRLDHFTHKILSTSFSGQKEKSLSFSTRKGNTRVATRAAKSARFLELSCSSFCLNSFLLPNSIILQSVCGFQSYLGVAGIISARIREMNAMAAPR